MRRALALLSAVVFVCLASSAAAQTAASLPSEPHLFLERAYFAPGNPWGRGVPTLTFEGDAATHFFIFNTMDWEWTHSGGWRFAMPISFIPVVRMSTTVSNPVLTPSYQVRPIWFQAIHLAPESRDTKAFALWAISAGAMHYSNGQDGCTYQGYVRDTTLEGSPCIVRNAPLAAQRRPNLRDGDFSTTFFPIAWNRRWGRMLDTSLQVRYQHTVGVEIQINPLGMNPGGLSRDLALEYGRHRINASYEFEWRAQKWGAGMHRVAVRAGLRTPQDSGSTWTTSALEYSRIYDRRLGFGWFVRGTFGGDYYNIHFKEKSNPLVTLGAMWDIARIDYYNHFGRPCRGEGARC